MITRINVHPGNLRLIDTVLTMITLRQHSTNQDQSKARNLYPGNQTLPGYTNNDICGMYIYNEETSLPIYPKIIRIDIIPFYSNSGQYTDFSGCTDKRGVQEFFSDYRFFESARAIFNFSDIPY